MVVIHFQELNISDSVIVRTKRSSMVDRRSCCKIRQGVIRVRHNGSSLAKCGLRECFWYEAVLGWVLVYHGVDWDVRVTWTNSGIFREVRNLPDFAYFLRIILNGALIQYCARVLIYRLSAGALIQYLRLQKIIWRLVTLTHSLESMMLSELQHLVVHLLWGWSSSNCHSSALPTQWD